MLRKLFALSVFTTLCALAVTFYTQRASTQTDEIIGKDFITLSGRAKRAKARGEYQLNITTSGEFDSVATVDDAFSRYSVLVVEQLLKRSYVVDDMGMRTWYKFRVHETLAQKPLFICTDCSAGAQPVPPADLLPLNSNEILVYAGGGEAVIEDVSVSQSVSDDYSYLLTQIYLLLLNFDAAQKVGGVDLGPTGIFMITGTDTITPVLVDADGAGISSPVADGLAARYGNSLSQLKAALNPQPQPTSCDPDGSREAACYDNGGTWTSSTCLCRVVQDPCMRKPWLCDGGYNY